MIDNESINEFIDKNVIFFIISIKETIVINHMRSFNKIIIKN